MPGRGRAGVAARAARRDARSGITRKVGDEISRSLEIEGENRPWIREVGPMPATVPARRRQQRATERLVSATIRAQHGRVPSAGLMGPPRTAEDEGNSCNSESHVRRLGWLRNQFRGTLLHDDAASVVFFKRSACPDADFPCGACRFFESRPPRVSPGHFIINVHDYKIRIANAIRDSSPLTRVQILCFHPGAPVLDSRQRAINFSAVAPLTP